MTKSKQLLLLPSVKTRVLFADDHRMFSAGIERLISAEPDLLVAKTAVDGEGTLQALSLDHFDVLLTDLSMPGISGLDLVRAVRAEYPELPILVLTLHNSVQLAQAVVDAGANGFITKSADPQDLIQALREVAQGGHFMEPTLMEAIVFSFDKPSAQRLSSRQKEILGLLAAGMSNREIAAVLQLSEKTVSTHRVRLTAKLGAQSRVHLMKCATDCGVLLPS